MGWKLWFGMCLCVGALSSSAWAAGPCDRLTGLEKATCMKEQGLAALPKVDIEKMKINPTGVQAIDDVFAPVDAILVELREAKTQLAQSKIDIGRALGKKQCETMGKAAARFAARSSGNLTVTMKTVSVPLVSDEKLAKIKAKFEAKGKPVPPAVIASLPKMPVPMPQLEAASGGSGSQGALVDAVNKALEGTTGVIRTSVSIPPRMQGTVAAASMLPVKAPKAIKKMGLDKDQAAEVLENMKGNLVVVLALPKLALSTMSELKDLFAAVQSIAGGDAGLLPGPREVRGKKGHIYKRYSDDYIRIQMGSKYRCLRPKSEPDSAYQEAVRAMKSGEPMDLDSQINRLDSEIETLESERNQKQEEADTKKKKKRGSGLDSKKVLSISGIGAIGAGGYMLYSGWVDWSQLKTESDGVTGDAAVNIFRQKEKEATTKMAIGGGLIVAGGGAVVTTLLSTSPAGPGMMIYMSGPW